MPSYLSTGERVKIYINGVAYTLHIPNNARLNGTKIMSTDGFTLRTLDGQYLTTEDLEL